VRRAQARLASLTGRGAAAAEAAAPELSPELAERLASLERQVSEQRDQLRRVRAAVQELRGLGGRVAEIADVVTELLVTTAQRDDPDFQRILARYRKGI
jgi:hypothetical protein